MALAVIGIGELVYFVALCPPHRAWMRTSVAGGDHGRSVVVQDRGAGVARPGDAIYVCTTPHCIGPLCHEDRACYCAPIELGAPALGRAVGGDCTVDNRRPSRDDDFGACRRARCDQHIDAARASPLMSIVDPPRDRR